MRKLTFTLVAITFVVLSLVVMTKNSGFVEGASQTKSQLPPGKWSFSAHPFMGEGYESRPVVVTSVRTEAKTLSVTAVRVRNISSKPVAAIRLGWYLADENNNLTNLQQSETSFIPMDKALETDKTELFKVSVVSFLDIYKPLVRDGRLEGSYRLEIAVTEILFEDQSTWRVGQQVTLETQPSKPAIVNASLKNRPLTVMPLKLNPICPKQQCKYVEGPPDGYSCSQSDHNEYCTNCVTSCCNTLCNDPSPSCGPCN